MGLCPKPRSECPAAPDGRPRGGSMTFQINNSEIAILSIKTGQNSGKRYRLIATSPRPPIVGGQVAQEGGPFQTEKN
jgi:hypothetical protein